jgi:hypothetical protein
MLERSAKLPAFPAGMDAAETRLKMPIVFSDD